MAITPIWGDTDPQEKDTLTQTVKKMSERIILANGGDAVSMPSPFTGNSAPLDGDSYELAWKKLLVNVRAFGV